MDSLTPIEKRRMLLLQAAKVCGSQAAFSKKAGLNRHHCNEYLNGTREIALYHAINIQTATNGKIRVKDIMATKYRTSEEYKKAIDTIEAWSNKAESTFNYLVPANTIYTGKYMLAYQQSISSYYLERAVILDDMQDNCFSLAGGSRSFYVQQNYNRSKIQSKVFKFLKMLTEDATNFREIIKENHLLVSEKTEIGLYIERLIGNRQGKRMDLQLRDKYPEVKFSGRTRKFVVNLIGFKSDYTYRQAKDILNRGAEFLIEAMDRQIIPISKAAAMIKLPQSEQFEIIEQTIQKKKLAIEPEFLNHWRYLCQ